MNNKYIKLVCSLIIVAFGYHALAQEKPIELSIGSIKTELKQTAIDFGIRYIKSLDSLFLEQDILIAGKNSLFQATPDFNVQSGTNDAFSSINAKMQGLIMFFPTTTVAGLVTPDTRGVFHCLPLSLGVETNNKFNTINGIFEIGYVPWYQSAMMKTIPQWIKHTKVGIFIQAGYKFSIDTTGNTAVGGQIDESKEKADDGIFRAKGSFAIDTKSLFKLGGIGVGLVGSADGWYDFLNSEIYYALQGNVRFYLTKNKDKYFDITYQKGSGAPNFNQGDQYGIGLTVTF